MPARRMNLPGRLPRQHATALRPSLEASGRASHLLSVRDLEKSFGALVVLSNVSLDVEHGEQISILGPSGSGKTTLLRCLNLLERPDRGSITFDGCPLPLHAPDRVLAPTRARIGMVFQDFNLFPHLTALDNVALAPHRVAGLSKKDARDVASETLARVGLANKADEYPQRLSGGQQQRVGIARAVAMQPELILLDEPTSALDPELVGEVLAVIRLLAEDGLTMIVVTHEVRFAAEVASRAIVMDHGAIVEEGPAVLVLTSPQTERAQVFLRRILNAERGATTI